MVDSATSQDASASSWSAALLRRLQDFAALVKFSHTIFLFPFALSAVILAHGVRPLTLGVMFWVVVALVSARSAAMVMNRIADRDYDAQNPRTKDRPLITGQVSALQAWLWLVAACAIFVLAAWRLGDICLKLSPVALIWVLGYSFTKRFTALCHVWLGLATALAPLGAWLAVAGQFSWGAVVLALACAAWVAGFDVIYACQDIAFDQEQGLKSLPARLGLSRALWVSRGLHAVAMLGFFLVGLIFGLGRVYFGGVGLIAAILLVEQWLVARRLANVPMAFFTLNGLVSILYLAFLALDRWWGTPGV
ncbi:MAG: 4-hydroxybenzoate octaprenyltransferase [Desulfarculus sp.]|nr:4-hydroxybenzoate octaprenyltransferase [Desulfarculus sp.]